MSSPPEDPTEDGPIFLDEPPYLFVETLSRELDSALAAVGALAGQLGTSASGAERAAQIQEYGARLRPVLQSLAHLQTLQHEDLAESGSPVDVADVADGLVKEYEEAAHDQGIVLTLNTPNSPVEVTTDRDTLRRALGHLLANAIEFTSDGEVTLHVAPGETTVECRVRDSGVGIPADVLPGLFDAFAQRVPDGGPHPKGIGLGLSLARAFARHLGGTLEAESEPGVGSIFTLRIPYQLGTVQSSDEEDPHLRLLAVEENEAAQRLLRRILRDHYDVDFAAEAGEAVRKAQDNDYDAFVLDVNLEGRRTGVEVLHEVRKMERYASVPVVACTAYAMDPHLQQFLRVGFDDVVTKPVSKRELLGAIEHELETPSSREFQVPEGSLTGIELPPLPTTLIEITELISSDSSHDTGALTEVLQKDQVVSQWLLHHINSAYYGLRMPIETVERAVSYLGFQRVCNLVLTKVIGNSFPDAPETDARRVQRYIMTTSTLAAFIARELAEEFGIAAPETAYTGGMFAQIGRLALLSTEGETYVDLWYERHDRTASFQGPPPQGQEILNCQEDYRRKGLAVGKACNLSDDLEAVLRGHHRPRSVDEQYRPLVSTVSLALEVAHRAGDLEDEHPWGNETALIETVEDESATQYLTTQVAVSSEELAATVVDITEDAQAFVRDVVD